MSLNARSYLLDAGILALYYAGKRAVKPYFDRILSLKATGFVSEVNLAEFYYKTAQGKGIETAETWYLQVRQSRLRIIGPDEAITRDAALWKVRRRDLSLADCFALATMHDRAEVLLTTDVVLGKVKTARVVYISPFQGPGNEKQHRARFRHQR